MALSFEGQTGTIMMVYLALTCNGPIRAITEAHAQLVWGMDQGNLQWWLSSLEHVDMLHKESEPKREQAFTGRYRHMSTTRMWQPCTLCAD